jgi:glycosyltransferase involved in cell wall biosynthesis
MKKKILYVHHAGGFGGAPKSMSYIIKNLDKDRFTHKLLNIERGPINKFFKENNIDVEEVNSIRPFHGSTVVEKSFKLFIRNWFFLLPSIFKASNILKKEKPDLIHLNSTCLFAFAIAAKMNNIKVISHVREPVRTGIWGAPLRYFCKKYIDGFMAICENDLISLKISPLNKKIEQQVVYNFVETITESITKNNILKNELELPNDAVIFLYLARFAKSNGWEELIEMAKQKNKLKSNYHFVLVGASNESHFKRTDSKNIHILPFRQDVIDILQGSDVFVCPFVLPHFARGVIEASALGLPIVGANIGGVTELIINKQTGYIYKDEKEFFKYINILGDNKLKRTELGGNGINLAKEKFNIEINLKQTYNFYKRII